MRLQLASSTGQSVNVAPEAIKHVNHSEETLYLRIGDVVEAFGHLTIWDEHCVSSETVRLWRQQGDPLCDAALEELFEDTSPIGIDLFTRLEAHVKSQDKTQLKAVHRFWDAIHLSPPHDIQASIEEMRLAKELFLDNSIQIMQALLYYSLAGGFASPRIVRTLQAVSYLVPKGNTTEISTASNNRTYARLLETFQFVLDVMGCDASATLTGKSPDYLLPGGEGWKSAVRVRMLHGVARARANKRLRKENGDNFDVPVSQEDMSATLSSFSTVPLWTLSRLGLRPSREHMNSFLALWRHVGFYLGVSPAILSRYFTNIDVSDKFLASIVLHAFSPDDHNDVQFVPPTIPILQAVSYRGPLKSSFEYNCAAARYFLGPQLAAHLGLAETSWTMRLKLRGVLFMQAFPVRFGRTYGTWIRKGWVEKRRHVMGAGMVRSVRNALGMRRTAFRPLDKDVELDETARRQENVVPDYSGAKLLTRSWREVMAEMIGVSVGGCLLLCFLAWKCTKSTLFP